MAQPLAPGNSCVGHLRQTMLKHVVSGTCYEHGITYKSYVDNTNMSSWPEMKLGMDACQMINPAHTPCPLECWTEAMMPSTSNVHPCFKHLSGTQNYETE